MAEKGVFSDKQSFPARLKQFNGREHPRQTKFKHRAKIRTFYESARPIITSCDVALTFLSVNGYEISRGHMKLFEQSLIVEFLSKFARLF
jgi:hypothetical protein